MGFRQRIVLAALLCSCHLTATAGMLSLNSVDSGQFDWAINSTSGDPAAGNHSKSLVDLSTRFAGSPGFFGSTYGYMIYDLSGLSVDVVSASIELTLTGDSDFGNVFVDTINPLLLADLQTAPTGSLSDPDFFDLLSILESGDAAGLTGVSGPGVYDASLDSGALSLINSTSNLIGFRVEFAGSTVGPPMGLPRIGLSVLPTLVLTTEMSGVPTPSSLSLLCLAFLLMGAQLRERRNSTKSI